MSEAAYSHEWTRREKIIYFITLVPFLVAFLGSAYLIFTISGTLVVILLGLYLVANIFQAACCIGCPYRGRYCPALFGVYLGNILSTVLYRNRTPSPRFFQINATLGEISVLAILGFACYWVATLNVWYAVGVLALSALHMGLFLTQLCPQCGYRDTCPAGQTACRMFVRHTR